MAVVEILLGLVLGIALTYNLCLTLSFCGEPEFVIPWPNLLVILGLAFLGPLLATLSPSRRASALPRRRPSQACERPKEDLPAAFLREHGSAPEALLVDGIRTENQTEVLKRGPTERGS